MSFIIMNPEYNMEDLPRVQALVKQSHLFVMGPSNINDPYDLNAYILASNAHKRDLRALIDNNLLTRAIELSEGASLPSEPEKRKPFQLSAAVMAYLIIGEFLIEPCIALYEKAANLGNHAAKSALLQFRIADNIHPQQWLDIALERRTKISEREIEEARSLVMGTKTKEKEENYEKELHIWKLNYYFILMAANLWKKKKNDLEAAIDFINWMETDGFLNSVAAIFSLVFFSPNRYSRMLKGVNSPSYEKLEKGLRNATWDLVYIKHWAKNCRESDRNTLWLLCSNDTALRSVAANLFEDHRLGQDHLKIILTKYWGEKNAKAIIKTYNKVFSNINSDQQQRDLILQERFENLDKSINELELKLKINITTW